MTIIDKIIWGLGKAYWIALFALVPAVLFFNPGASGETLVHQIFYWVPAIAITLAISGSLDMLKKIRDKKATPSIGARLLDLMHWFLLIGITISTIMLGGATLLWFGLQLILMAVIGWSLAVLIKYHHKPNTSEKLLGVAIATVTLVVGLTAGYIRTLDTSNFGWGWLSTIVQSVASTFIVLIWTRRDVRKIRDKGHENYPRTLFTKGFFANTLNLLFWVSIMTQVKPGFTGGFGDVAWWAVNAGLTFNILVGNVIWIVFWKNYEKYRAIQTKNFQ